MLKRSSPQKFLSAFHGPLLDLLKYPDALQPYQVTYNKINISQIVNCSIWFGICSFQDAIIM